MKNPQKSVEDLFVELIWEGHDAASKLHARQPPTFSLNRINYILIFSGCFNPPHVGHLNFMRHSYLTAQRDLNVVAALFEICSDEFLEKKCKAADLRLNQTQRAKMILTDERVGDWAWVYMDWQYGMGGALDGQLENFKTQARQRDIRIRFLKLRSAELDLELCGRDLGLGTLFNDVAVNTHGRRGETTLSKWGVGDARWTRLGTQEDKVQRYRMMLLDKSAVTWGFVWVYTRGSEEKKSAISSTGIKRLASVQTMQRIEEHGVLPRMVLGWDALRCEGDWIRWHKSVASDQVGDLSDVCRDLENEMEAALLLEARD